ncbi:aspartate/glutamate racemase family protein [Ramlibacter sp. PS4R-6]|uniref:aspartate/glutamate racemase family protein n=1 Tax=Ramlibacter sp. PS4R-6 TaxID=3133438 RepID=UPI003097B9D6
MAQPRILVINPNSTEAVTRAVDEALSCYADDAQIRCVTLKEGPPGIELQQHADSVIVPLGQLLKREEGNHDAFVLACYSDPGLHSLREQTKKPVLGIGECGLLTAMTMGHRVGVIAILRKSIPRHLRYIGAMGIGSRLAGERALEIGVVGLQDAQRTAQRMVEIGRQLRDDDGADVVVLGCAGMAAYREGLQQELGVPVVDPTQAAVGMAIARVRLGW